MATKQLICEGSALQNGGAGVRFEVNWQGRAAAAFVIRFHGKVVGYLNRCAHVPVELDWQAGDFFDISKSYLVCATHGAWYEPLSGLCRGGPCKGRSLQALVVEEAEQQVYLLPQTDCAGLWAASDQD
jgi:nitrite reductase/ring-hydroxylating ferredoxin subunit